MVKGFQREGVEAVVGHKPDRPFRFSTGWLALAIAWITVKAPRDFGSVRSRWSYELVAVLMLRDHDLEVSSETLRGWSHRGGLVFYRP